MVRSCTIKNKRFLKKLFDFVIGKRMLRDAKILVAETDVGRQEYIEIMPELEKNEIAVLSPPFDTDEFIDLPIRGEFRNKFNLDQDKKIIMFLGRIHYIKGNDFLIKGFAEALKKETIYFLVLVGPDDGHMEECKNLVDSLDIKSMFFSQDF